MLRKDWSVPPSRSQQQHEGDTLIEETIVTTTTTTTTSTSRRRLPSAPEARLRRLFTPAHAQRPISAPVMCSDSVIVPGDVGPVANMSNHKSPCYCHINQDQQDQTQKHFEFTCKLNFEDVNYNYNFIENEYYLPARIIPRFSSVPRSMSMLANRSRSDTSSDNEEECNSLADSLEDLTRINSRATFDDKPVRGDANALALMNQQNKNRQIAQQPVPKAEKFFVGLSEQVDNLGLQLPAFLKDKLDKRRQELEQKKLFEPLQTHRSRTPKATRRPSTLSGKFRPFESIPEESSETNNRIRIARSRAMARNFQPRFQVGHSQRALQGIVQESKDLSIISSDGTEAVQSFVPLPVPSGKSRDLMNNNNQPGWGNSYRIKGPEEAAMDKENARNDGSKVKARKKWTKIETSSSEERTTTTLKLQNPSKTRTVRQRATTSVTRSSLVLPRLSNGERVSARSEGSRPLPNLQRHQPVPAIKPKSARVVGSGALPSLPSPSKDAADDRTFTRPTKGSKSAKSSPLQSPSKPKMVIAKQSNSLIRPEIEPGTIVAETGNCEPGTWSVTLTGLYPQPEMELRLVFPPSDESKETNEKIKDSDGSPRKKNERMLQSPMNETNSADYILTFKNKQANNTSRPGSAGSIKSRSRPTSAGSPSKTKALVPVSKSLVPASTEIVASSPRSGGDEILMWPEVQSLMQEQMMRHVKKQITTVTTSETKHVTTTTQGAIMVQRLRGGEGSSDAVTYSSGMQPGKNNANLAVATQRRKRASS